MKLGHQTQRLLLYVKVVVAAFNQEKALAGAFSVIVQLHRFIVYTALVLTVMISGYGGGVQR